MERGGGSGERLRKSSGCLILKEKRDVNRRTVSSIGTKRNSQKRRSKVVVTDSESNDERKTSKEKFVEKRDMAFVRRNNEASGSSKSNVYEFDEYDRFENLRRKRFDNGSVGVSGRITVSHVRVGNSSVGGSGSGREGRKRPYANGACSMSSEDSSSSESDSDETIRVPGRNGVLKVKVNNRMVQKRANVVVKPTFRKPNNVESSSESEESDMSRKPKRRKPELSKSNNKVKTSLPVKPIVREEKRGKPGGGTEKQRLRERIKGMLMDAGWTIDYRPRRNQSYQDAVYVNPSGTAFWSIIKAYDALLKQLKDEEADARPRKEAAVVASVSEDIVNSLARKAKSTWAEMTKKWKKVSSGSDGEDEADEEDRGDTNTSERKSVKQGRNGINWDDLQSKSKRSLSSGLGSHHLHGRKSKTIGKCTLLVRSSKEKENPAIDGFNPYSGKRTLLSWLIESGVVQLRQMVQYMSHRGKKVMLEGWITREGIHCMCCSKILTLSRFEIHAGSKSSQPSQNIYMESGPSLLQCLVRAWNMQKDAKRLSFHHVGNDGDDPNDDACGICGDGGDLLCCDGCPSTYHQTCLGMQVLPPGDWHCPSCTCKFCDAAVHSGGEDGNLLLLSCSMCERKYHKSCTSEVGADKVQSTGSASSFCGSKCFELFQKLQKYLGVKNEIEGGYSWTLIHRIDTDNADINSQLSAQRIENNSKLAVGLAIMDECFLPIIDRRSGVNLIRNVLYNSGSNFSRINYTGFYTAILEKGDEIISAASLRFHGMQLAEMPFIGTRHIYRRQGMCRRLFDAIESAMRSLMVETLVIPAIPDFLHAWTGNFGFSPLDESVRKEMMSLNTMVFPGIDTLQKLMLHEVVNVHKDAVDSERKTEEKKPEFFSPIAINPFSVESDEFVVDAASCYKSILASHEENIPVSIETAMDTRSSREDGLLMDLNLEADDTTGLVSKEIQQASNNLSSSVNSISQEGKTEHNCLNLNSVPSCKENDILAAGAKFSESKDNAFADGFLL